MTSTHYSQHLLSGLLLLPLLAGCSPTIRVEAPKEPIVINMNIKIDHEIRVKVDREIDTLLQENTGLF